MFVGTVSITAFFFSMLARFVRSAYFTIVKIRLGDSMRQQMFKAKMIGS